MLINYFLLFSSTTNPQKQTEGKMYSGISCKHLKFLLPIIFLLLLFGVLTAGSDKKDIEFGKLSAPSHLSALSILSPTQDTILYDNNTALHLDTNSNAWTGVRFTPVDNFELQAIYFAILNQYNNTTDGCSLYVVGDDGTGQPDWPSGVLGSYWVAPPVPDRVWIQVDLSSPISFSAYEDFHVIYGPAPGGPYPGPGWWNLFDSDGTTTQRSYVSHDNRQTWLTITNTDAFIRAGGEYIPVSYTWSSNGPTDIPVISLAIHPSSPDTIYAGTVGNGIYLSTDGGGSWASVSTDIDTLYVATIAINPQNPQIIYAGAVGGFEATGIYKTANGGTNWNHTVSGIENLDITSLAINPAHPDSVYAGVFADWITWLGGGVYLTSNGAVTWSNLVSGMTPVHTLVVRDLVIDPIDPQIVYAGTIHEGPGHGGVFKSTDGGDNWSAKNTGLESLYITCLAIDPNADSILYACSRDTSIFKSTNGGDSWFYPTSLVITDITSIVIDPSNSQRIFLGTGNQGIYQSEDAGANWETINVGLGSLTINALDMVHISSTILYAATDNGVWQCIISEGRRQK